MAKPGRPALDGSATEPSASLHLRLAAKDYDQLDKQARERRTSIQGLIRDRMKQFIKDERGA